MKLIKNVRVGVCLRLLLLLPVFLVLSSCLDVESLLIFPGSRRTITTYDFSDTGLARIPDDEWEVLQLDAGDGVKVNTVWIAGEESAVPTGESRKTIAYFNGNESDLYSSISMGLKLRSLGFDSVGIEYRGYGATADDFTTSESSVFADGEAVYRYIADELQVPPGDIVLMGYSLGTAVAVNIASRHEDGGVFLLAPMYSADAIATHLAGGYAMDVSWYTSARMDNASRIADIDSPVCFLHGRKDALIPWQQSRELYHLADGPKRLEINENAAHPDLPGHWEWYGPLLNDFIRDKDFFSD